MTTQNDPLENVRRSFEEAFNMQGFGFHHSVLRRAFELSNLGGSAWLLEAIEVPVEVRGKDTRVDFVLSLRSYNEQQPHIYLLAECKRVNPAYGMWCFGRTPFFNRTRSSEYYVIENLKRNENIYKMDKAEVFNPFVTQYPYKNNVYNIALDVRTKNNNPNNSTGNSTGQGTPGKAVEDAAGQILKGLNGFVEFVYKNPNILTQRKHAIFLPVIFTTAELWTTDIDISTANIDNGNLQLTKESLKKQSWLGYQYHQSQGLKHSLRPENLESELGELIDVDFVRTIPIVSPSGIEDFLSWSSNINLWFR